MTEQQKKARKESAESGKIKWIKDNCLCDQYSNKDFVFISYKSDDYEKVLEEIVYDLCHEHGLNVYFDTAFDDESGLWIDQFYENMKSLKCKAMLAFVNDNYYSSYATLMEMMASQTKNAGGKPGTKLLVLPIMIGDITDVSSEKNTGLGTERYSDNTKNIHWKNELEQFNKLFAMLIKDKMPLEGEEDVYERYNDFEPYCEKTDKDNASGKMYLDEVHCRYLMEKLVSSLRKNNIDGKNKSYVEAIKDKLEREGKASVFNPVIKDKQLKNQKNIVLTLIDWNNFDKVKSFSYNGKVYNVSDAQNAYITIVDVLHQNEATINPNQIVEYALPAYVKFADGTELSIPKGMYQTIIEGVAKDKVTLYAEPSTEGVPTKAYTILSRDVEKELVKETSLTSQEATLVNQVANVADVTNNFTDQLAHFSKYFNKLFDTKNVAWKNGNNIGRMPSIDMDVTINFNCECLEFYSIREHSLKKMFGNIIDYFYQMSGERYFNYIVDVCRAGKTKFPMIIDESFEGDKKWYYNIQGSEFSVYNNYSAKEIFTYLNKHVEMYFDYLQKEGNAVDVSDVIVDYKFGKNEDAALMQIIREQGCHVKSAGSSTNFTNEPLVSFETESFVEFIKIFENISTERAREYKEKQKGYAPSIPFSNIVLHLPEHVAYVNEIHAEGWQELYKAVIDALYEATDGDYCKMRTEVELNKNLKYPKIITKEYYDEFDDKAKSNYKSCTNGQYYYYMCYRSYNVLKEGIKKELDIYMNYFADSKGIQDDITSVKISYSLPESYADLFR